MVAHTKLSSDQETIKRLREVVTETRDVLQLIQGFAWNLTDGTDPAKEIPTKEIKRRALAAIAMAEEILK